MRQLGFYRKVLIVSFSLWLAFNSTYSLADEFFQDAVFEELHKVGVDTEAFRHKLKEGDYKGAKTLLEEEKEKTSLSEVEEEVANLIARKVLKRVKSGEEATEETFEEPSFEPAYTPPVQEETITKVNLEGEDHIVPVAEVHREVARTGPIPGQEVSPYAGMPKALTPANEIVFQEPQIDKDALMQAGVRELRPGMSIFRFLKVQVKIWARGKEVPTLNMLPKAASLTH